MLTRRPVAASNPKRRGFTLIELLVVISIIATLIALILPAIQQAREAARRTECLNHLKNFGIAMANFASSHKGNLPSSGYYIEVAGSSPPSVYASRSWVVELLPYLDQQSLYDRWNPLASWDDGLNPAQPLASGGMTNLAIGQTAIAVLGCPDDDSADGKAGGLTYVVNTGFGDTTVAVQADLSSLGHSFVEEPCDWNNNGTVNTLGTPDPQDQEITQDSGAFWAFFDVSSIPALKSATKNASINIGRIQDGAANTFLISENINAGIGSWANPDVLSCGFFFPYNAAGAVGAVYGNANTIADVNSTWRMNDSKAGPDGQAPFPNSGHPGIVLCGMCDGSARPFDENIDDNVYTRLITPAGTKIRTVPSGAFLAEQPLSDDEF